MAEHRFTIKAADLVTPSAGVPDFSVESVMLPVDAGKATVFGLFTVNDHRQEVREAIGRIMRTHLEQAAQSMVGEANVPRRFEAMLGDVNAALAESAASAAQTVPLSAFEAVIGVMTNTQLFISGIGNLLAVFLHKTAERRFVIYELNAQFGADAEATWEKAFVTILDGELQQGDIFYVATRTPSQAISLSELQDVLVTLPPAGALQRIRQFLPHDAPYGALCFHIAEDERGGPPKKMNPIASLNQLGNTKSETADLLGEQGSDVIGFVRRVAGSISTQLAAPGSRGYKSIAKRTARAIVQVIAALIVIVLQIIRGLGNLAVRAVTWTSDRFGTRQGPNPAERMKNQLARVKNLPPASKYIGASILGVVLVLAVSVGYMNHQGAKRKSEEAFKSTVSRIEEKTTAAEASLIYDDTEQANRHLTEAAVLLETLSADTAAHESQIATLKSSLEAIMGRIRHVTEVATTVVAQVSDGAQFVGVAPTTSGLFGLTVDGKLYQINELEHTVTAEQNTNGSIGSIMNVASEGANLLFLDSNKRLGRADVATNTLNPVTSGVDALASAEDVFLYNGTLYVLSAASQQVVKMRAQGPSYEAGTNWISNRATDLTPARDLAIDGAIYIVTNNDIIRFRNGNEAPWERETLEPALGDPADVWTDIESKYLYILDRSGGRVIVYEKETGKLVMQYTNADFASAVSFIIREKENTILVATPTKIVSFPATHLLN